MSNRWMQVMKGASCTLLGLLVLAAAGEWAAQAPRAAAAFFPVAVWYSGGKARAPMLEKIDATSAARWGHDLDLIKATGFNTVKTWVDWSSAEPQPGQFNFANLDLLMRLAQERGLRVIIQIYTDSAPDWVGQRYPDGRFVDRSGAVINSQAAPGFCIDHPGVRAEIVKFLEALSREANRYPALYGWDVWSEPHVINWADFPYLVNPEFCFCKYSQARFREWLKAKYKTLAALNAAWYRRFHSWQEVEPPRFPTILSYTDYIDWRAFIDDKLAGDLKTRVEAIRSADSTHPITSHAAAPALFTSPTDGYGEPDDWKMAGAADFFGTSLYPMHSESTHPWTYTMLSAGLDFERSAGHSFNKGFWIGELQAGQGVTGMRIADVVTPHDVEYWMWESIAHGAREIAVYAWYPMSSGFESNGYGLIHLDGTLTERAKAAGQVASVISQHGQELLESHPAPAQVAILYDRLSYFVGGEQPTLSKLGNAPRDSMMGLYKVFLERQIPVDFVSAQDVVRGKLSQYKILFMPFPVMLSKAVAEGVERYVRQGGTAVGEARLAWNDQRGFASDIIPGFGLDRVFGAREKLIRPVEQPQLILEPDSGLKAITAGEKAAGEAFAEELEPLAGAKVLAHFDDGAAALVENSFGKGKAILAGTFLGLAYDRHPAPATAKLLVALARAARISPEVEVSGSNVSQMEIRRLISGQEEFVFAFNHSQSPVDAGISVWVPWRVGKVEDVVRNEPVPFQQSGGRIVLKRALPPGGIIILRVGRD